MCGKLIFKRRPNCNGSAIHEDTKKFCCRPGLTLTEVIIASALMLVAFVPILKALTSAQLTARIIERKTRSLVLAQAKLDEIKARSIYSYSSSYSESGTSLDGSYRCNVTDDADPSLRTVTVSVGYDSNSDSTLSTDEVEVTLATYIAKRQ